MSPARKQFLKRVLLGGLSLAFIVATFAFFLPKVADYGQVWEVIKGLSWPWVAALLAAVVLNIVTFAPPWRWP
jgi:uncharacterized membrane protein YbhN (UPF0104 family)